MSGANVSYGRLVWNQYKRRRASVAAAFVVVGLVLMALAAPLLAGYRPLIMKHEGQYRFPALSPASDMAWNIDFRELRDKPPDDFWAVYPLIRYAPDETDLESIWKPPNEKHWLGTDDVGRDLLARVIWGSRISLSVGVVAVGIYVSLGLILGALAGYFGGWVDNIISRCIEVMICIPPLPLIITALAFMGPGLMNVMLVIGLTGWPSVARLARAEFLRLRHLDYVTAVKSLGCTPPRIMFRHVLPNAMAPILVAATFGVASAILLESSLSFLGFGVPEPQASWGSLLAGGRQSFSSWWLTVFPGGVIFVTLLAYNLVGEGLRNAVDARLKE